MQLSGLLFIGSMVIPDVMLENISTHKTLVPANRVLCSKVYFMLKVGTSRERIWHEL